MATVRDSAFLADSRLREMPVRPLDLGLDLGTLVLENGGSTELADRAFTAVLAACGVHDGFAVWRLDCVSAGTRRGGDTAARAIGPIAVNLRRVSAVGALVDAGRPIEVDRLPEAIASIGRADSTYGRWTMLVAVACAAGFFSCLQAASWENFATAFVAAGIGQAVRGQLRAFPIFATTVVCAIVSAFVAAAGLHVRAVEVAPATLVAAVVYLIPSLALINGFFDIVSHKYLVIGMQRIASAATLCAALAIAVALAVTVMR